MRIARVRHRQQELVRRRQALQQPAHVIRAADAVHAHRVHIRTRVHPRDQRRGHFARARESVRVRRKRDGNKRLRIPGLDVRRSLGKARVRGHGFHQEAVSAGVKKGIRQRGIGLFRVHACRCGADVRKDKRLIARCPARKLHRRVHKRALLYSILRSQADMRGKRIRLDRLAARRQIRPVQRKHLLRRGQARPLDRPLRPAL